VRCIEKTSELLEAFSQNDLRECCEAWKDHIFHLRECCEAWRDHIFPMGITQKTSELLKAFSQNDLRECCEAWKDHIFPMGITFFKLF
jgi:hypothetical protein